MMTVHDAAFMPDLPAMTCDDMPQADHGPEALRRLEQTVRRDLDLIRYPIRAWVLPKPAPGGGQALDALIVGGGQSGLATAFGLKRQRVDNILVIDENPLGREGPWDTYARMLTLRTDKYVNGMDLGLPSVSLRAWFEARYGRRAWEAADKLPRQTQTQYLAWYRDVLALPVRNECRLTAFHPGPDQLISVEIETAGKRDTIWCRELIFATGIEGNGTRNTLPFFENLPRHLWAHTGDAIDFSRLRGRRVAVLGGAASAFDNAAMAAEAGAAQVDLFHRRSELNPANPVAWAQFNGFLAHYPDLDMERKWRFMHHILAFNPAPPADTIQRVTNLPAITRHAGVAWTNAREKGKGLTIETTRGPHEADFAILGIGYIVDLTARAEFRPHLDRIALWRDVHTPPPGLENEDMSRSPFLGAHFEFQEKHRGAAPWLRSVFNFSRGAQLSMGSMPIGLSGVGFGVPRLVHGVCQQLFTEDADIYEAGMKAWQASGVVTNA